MKAGDVVGLDGGRRVGGAHVGGAHVGGGGHPLHPAALREYDIRGIVGDTLGDADAYAVGRSFATRIVRAGGTRVAVGHDGRLTSPALEAALVAGLADGGTDVIRIGLGATPMLYFAEATLGVDGGIQVTGSHNPPQYNGFKLVHRRDPVFGAAIGALAATSAAGDWSEGRGSVSRVDILDAYVARLAAGFRGGAFRIGWDPGNGAAGPAIQKLAELLPGEHHLIFADVDGNFPNHHPDPAVDANLAALQALVAENRLDFGVAFDGDGDRIGVVDARGRVIRADQLLALLAEPVLRAHPGAAIVADVKSSAALFDHVRALGGVPVMAPSGHSIMKMRMKQAGAPLAGEMSGHLFFGGDYYGFDDAPYAAVQLIGAVQAAGRPLAALLDALPVLSNTPEIRLPVDEERRTAVVDEVLARLAAAGAHVDRTDGARVTTPDGWWLLRASNTEPALTLRAEAADDAGLARLLAAVDAQLAMSGVARD